MTSQEENETKLTLKEHLSFVNVSSYRMLRFLKNLPAIIIKIVNRLENLLFLSTVS